MQPRQKRITSLDSFLTFFLQQPSHQINPFLKRKSTILTTMKQVNNYPNHFLVKSLSGPKGRDRDNVQLSLPSSICSCLSQCLSLDCNKELMKSGDLSQGKLSKDSEFEEKEENPTKLQSSEIRMGCEAAFSWRRNYRKMFTFALASSMQPFAGERPLSSFHRGCLM